MTTSRNARPRFDHERRLVLATVRGAIVRPSRRTLWFALLGIATAAVVWTAATSGAGPRDLGALRWFVVAGVWIVAALVVTPAYRLARASGPVASLRAADPLWFGLAGVADRTGDWTTRVRAWQAFAVVAAAALGGTGLLATAAPDLAPRLLAMGAAPAAASLALAVLLSRAALRTDDDEPVVAGPIHEAATRSLAASAPRRFLKGPLAYASLAAAQENVTVRSLLLAAVGCAILGAVSPWLAERVGGQAAWLAALAIVVGASARLAAQASRAPAAVATTWFRLGGTPRFALLSTLAVTAAVPSVGLATCTLAFASRIGEAPLGLALVPVALVTPVAIVALARMTDVFWPRAADRTGVAAWVRVVLAWAFLGAIATCAAAVAPYGALPAVAAATFAACALLAGAERTIAVRLDAAALART
jgi:hypothetical protein